MFASLFKEREPKVGSKPGTLIIPEEAAKPVLKQINYSPEEIEEREIQSVEQLSGAFSEKNISWVDIHGFGDKKMMEQIGELFELHPLLLEDVVNVPQRPKTEAYGDQVLILVRMVQVTEEGLIDLEQVSIVLGKNWILTFQERVGDILGPVRRRLRNKNSTVRNESADFLAYAIMDTIIDAYYPALELLGDRLEDLEDEVIMDPTPELLRELNRMKNRLVNLRRSIWPQREAINRLVRGDYPAFSENVRIYLRDTYDHCVQTSEVAEMYREMVTGLMNTYLSSISNRTNEVMKVLTIMASIFIPLTFLAGIYGMNFEFMPETHVWWAYPALMLVMLVMAGGMLWFFWRKGWITVDQPKFENESKREF